MLDVKMENCYGISKLSCIFDFLGCPAVSIYAPNGSMKTSFAKTFEDISHGNMSQDTIFSSRETVRKVLWGDGKIDPKNVFVIRSIDEGFHSDKIATLMANHKLRKNYCDIYIDINEEKDKLFQNLVKLSGLKIDEIAKQISFATMPEKVDILEDVFTGLEKIRSEVMNNNEPMFSKVLYKEIFDDKVLAVLKKPEVKQKIIQYMEQYNSLIEKAKFFRKGVFNHYNADKIAIELNKNGFFSAKHYIILIEPNGEKVEIGTYKKLIRAINQEKENIINDPTLREIFDDIDSLFKNEQLRRFRDLIGGNKSIIPELSDVERFRTRLWIDYLKENKEQYEVLMDKYEKVKKRLQEIVSQANAERTQWSKVIDIYNSRFSVPFTVTVGNQSDVMLKGALVPRFDFEYNDGRDTQSIEEEKLLEVLSHGERRALYLLNIIYEIEARKTAGQETIFIVDDIADSFDYKNKYAILEYLYELSKAENFYQVILTHNFDFYRTVNSRIISKRENKYHAIKESGNIRLQEEHYQHNPFNTWREKLCQNIEMLIASIPFARNIAEYRGDEDGQEKLVSFLHIKNDTDQLKISDVYNFLQKVININATELQGGDKNYVEALYKTACDLCHEQEIFHLEKKIVLSMAIRLKAEQFMINKIDDDEFVSNITSNQTRALFDKYKQKFSDSDNLETLEKVNLMTPENIHINSFMYEPILDMSGESLKRLYKNVSKL